MTKIKSFIIVLLLVVSQNWSYSQNNKEIDTNEYDCYEVLQYITYNNKTDTVIKTICNKKRRVIFSNSREYHYFGSLYSKEGVLLSNVNIKIEGTDEIRPTDKKQIFTNIFYERSENDSIKLQKHLINKTCCKWIDSLKSGIIENENRVWMHPIQGNQFILTEIAGFPDVNLPISIGNSWSTTLNIYEWGDWKNMTILNKYRVIGKRKYNLNNELIDCFEIESLSDFEAGINKHTYLFNSDYGFVLMNYEFYNGMKIIFEMKDCLIK